MASEKLPSFHIVVHSLKQSNLNVLEYPEILEEENVRTVDGDFVETIRRFSEPRLVEYTCDTVPRPAQRPLGCVYYDFALNSGTDDMLEP